jgi:hypothetical protein
MGWGWGVGLHVLAPEKKERVNEYVMLRIGYTVKPRVTNLIRSWGPFVTRNVRKPKLCVLNESYTATDALPPILPACRQPLLPACVFVTRDTVRHPRRFLLGKFVRELICSWWEAFVNRGSTAFVKNGQNIFSCIKLRVVKEGHIQIYWSLFEADFTKSVPKLQYIIHHAWSNFCYMTNT